MGGSESLLSLSETQQRRRKRIKKSCQIDFSADNKTYSGVSDNFSVDGLFIITDNPLSVQSAVSMTVHLPDGSTSKIKGLVRRVQRESHDVFTRPGQAIKCGMGIEITERDSNYMKFFISLLGSTRY